MLKTLATQTDLFSYYYKNETMNQDKNEVVFLTIIILSLLFCFITR